MAKQPTKASPSRLSNIIGLIRGNFDFNSKVVPAKPQAYGSTELISNAAKTRILGRAIRLTDSRPTPRITPASVLGIVQSSLINTGNERLENRKILQLMPEVDKAARLMTASTMAPNDLSRQEIKVVFNSDELTEQNGERLSEFATKFFQKKLNLKTSLPSWVYQFGYESGSCVFAIIPLKSFEGLEENNFIGTESFVTKVVEPIARESLFGFGDNSQYSKQNEADVAALESFASDLIHQEVTAGGSDNKSKIAGSVYSDLVKKIIGIESLSLTDNPSILQTSQTSREKVDKRTRDILHEKFIKPKTETIVSIRPQEDVTKKGNLIGDPILLRLPPESVTVIHTPGDPSDHQGYLILLNRNGNPIDSVTEQEAAANRPVDYNSGQGNVFSQVYNAYGMTTGSRGISNEDAMIRIYSQIIHEHLKGRMDKAGYNNIAIGQSDAVFRCMFARFLQEKQTRVLFLPKDLVTYMTFEMDQNGYGVSRLDRIKFNLGMKMAVQVSRVLASIKAAMDRRKIEVRFTDNLMENPEAIFQSVIREYVNKSTMSFSIDPNVIQSQIADKSVSIKGVDIPGMEQFDLTNEPDGRTSSVDFDPELSNYIDKAILNGLHVPAGTMNSLSEDEYARSVATTNLFFSMDVSIDQDIIIRCASDLIRKYAKYSETFRKELATELPNLEEVEKEGGGGLEKIESSVDDLIDQLTIALPKPNVAPSKAQFEALEAMISAITTMVTAIFPDELAGVDDSLLPTVRLLRAKFISSNIKAYLDSSGIAGVDVPETNFSSMLKDIGQLMDGLKNVDAMLKAKDKISAPVEESTDTGIPGY